MKKFVAMLCVVMMVMGLCGCGDVAETVKEKVAEPVATAEPAEPIPTEEPKMDESNASRARRIDGAWNMTNYYLADMDTMLPLGVNDYTTFECEYVGESEGYECGKYTMTYSFSGAREESFSGMYVYLGETDDGASLYVIVETECMIGIADMDGVETMVMEMPTDEVLYYSIFEK